MELLHNILIFQGGGGGGGGDQRQKQQEKMEQMENMKNGILSQVLDQEARARLNTIKLTKPEKGQQVRIGSICTLHTAHCTPAPGEKLGGT